MKLYETPLGVLIQTILDSRQAFIPAALVGMLVVILLSLQFLPVTGDLFRLFNQ